MNRLFYSLVLGVLFFLGAEVNAEENKIRISPQQIWIEQECIFVNFAGKWVSVSQINRDTEGFYIKPLESDIDVLLLWRCGKCGTWNWDSDECGKCGRSRN